MEEAICSFLQQDYSGPKELLILNDYEQQILAFDHPEVRVINVPVRFRTIGEKMNVAVALASHNLLFVWDDDDIYLSHRLAFSIEKFETKKGFFKPNKAWMWNNNLLSGPDKNLFHAGSCWSRDMFNAVRGYIADGPGHDAIFEECLERKSPGSTKTYNIKPEEIYYIYRWGGTGSYHLSGFGDHKPGENVGHDEVGAFVQQQIAQGEIPQGHIFLQPHWRFDYQQFASDYIRSIPNVF